MTIVENLVSDFLFVVIVIVIGWVFFIFTKRNRLLKFFGIGDDRRLVVYVSDLRLKSGDAFGADGKRRAYSGSAVTLGEIDSAHRFRDLFNYFLPSLSETPGFLSKLLISDVQMQILRSPSQEGLIEQSVSFITLGSPAYNIASGFVEGKLHSNARFELGKTRASDSIATYVEGTNTYNPSPSSSPSGSIAQEEFRFLSTSGSSPELSDSPTSAKAPKNLSRSIKPDPLLESPAAIRVDGIPKLTETTYGFIERIVDHERQRSVFYVAGISELATVGAANFLISKWEYLQERYKNDKNFLIMLRFEPADYKQYSIIFEKNQ